MTGVALRCLTGNICAVKEPALWREPRTTSAATLAKREQAAVLARRVQDIGGSLRPSEDSGRLNLVRDRILLRVTKVTNSLRREA
jgi:hypothetical protein